MHNARMSHKMKFHLLAMILIVLIVSVAHSLMQPAAQAPRIVTVVQYTPIIVDATWGKNCNPRIEEAMQYAAPAGPRPIIPDASAPVKLPLAPVSHNNVLDTVKKLCADQMTCTFTADSLTLGELLPSCPNQLEIRYYCTEAERVRSVNFNQGGTVTLDCSQGRY